MGKVVTFYSYGGAGRTMALANVAVRLAQLGLRVVAVDWDLQAPGLHRFLPGKKPLDAPDAKGLLDFLYDWREAVMNNAPAPPDIHDGYLYMPTVGNKAVGEPYEPGEGELVVLPAGRLDRSFGVRMDSLDLRLFYEQDAGGAAIETLRTDLLKAADVVLVDSRSGLNDIGGICALQLPDGVVFLSPPNERCYKGARDVARALKFAPPDVRATRSIPTTWFVLSRAPQDKRLLDGWLDAHGPSFDEDVKVGLWTGIHPLGIKSYYLADVPRWSFGEPIVPSVEGSINIDTDPLAWGYDKLAATIFAWAGEGEKRS